MKSPLPRMITTKELLQIVPYCPQHILRLEKQGKFPRRIKVGERRVGWWLTDVLSWVEARQLSHRHDADCEQSPTDESDRT